MKLTQELTKSRTVSRRLHRRSTTLTRDCYPWRDINGITIRDSTISISESTGEDCIAKLRDTLIENDLQLQLSIENAHRIVPFKDDGTSGPILAKFLYRPERFRVIKKKRDLRDSVRVSNDLIWEERQKKKQLGSVMKEA